jgi:3-hydroxyisobutyrate dehydrogenase and related beta-hydroxyacid dehydrogenases
MARNIAKAGFPLTVYNRTRSKAEALAAEVGCAVVDTPRAAAEAADILITIVSDVPDVEEVYFAPNTGILGAARPGLTCVDMGTVGPACVLKVGAALKEQGVGFVDAPVSGGTLGAQKGTLSIMAGGSEEDFAACVPVFEAMGQKIVHCGPVGQGQTTKLANQIVVAVTLEAACEGVLFALKSGANIEAVLDAVGAGAAGSWTWTNLGPKIAKHDYTPGFKVEHQIKDLRLALEAAQAVGLDLPGTRLVLEQFKKVLEKNSSLGEQGTQSLITALE